MLKFFVTLGQVLLAGVVGRPQSIYDYYPRWRIKNESGVGIVVFLENSRRRNENGSKHRPLFAARLGFEPRLP